MTDGDDITHPTRPSGGNELAPRGRRWHTLDGERAARGGVGPLQAVAHAVADTRASLGARACTIEGSRPAFPGHFDGSRFRNTEPDAGMTLSAAAAVARDMLTRGRVGRPRRRIPVALPEFPDSAADLAVTWLGHASVLMEIDGCRILADPMLSERASPANFVGPRRLHPPPVAVSDLPRLDAIVISHDHYDHLDHATVVALRDSQRALFLVPLGIGAHLRAWGVPADRIVEMQWGHSRDIEGVRIACSQARHFSGRLFRRNTTLWSSWAVAGPRHRMFFGGDTGYMAAFAEIGRRYGPFDLTVLPIGAYDTAWPDIHMTPEQALRAHRDLRGTTLLPMHWATFDLAPHPWAEPVERLLRAIAADATVGDDALVLPRPGQRIVPAERPLREPWWR